METRTLALAALFALSAAVAGSLLSPPGAGQQVLGRPPAVPGPDGRVAIRALPFTIERCGSYFVAGCLTGAPGEDGITIAASDVTLDLNGFTLQGVPGSLAGIAAGPGVSNLRVLNGTVRGWGGGGVVLEAAGSTASDLRAVSNAGTGIAAGAGSVVERCLAQGNGADGILAGFGSEVADCVAAGNQGNGIVAAIAATTTGCTVRDCTARGNAADGIVSGDGTVVSGCSVSLNGGAGISTGVGCTIRGSAATLNGGSGIRTVDSLVQGNAAKGNTGPEIDAPGSTVLENHM